MKEVVNLRPNRDLLDSDFNGYKLSLDSTPIYEKYLNSEVDQAIPGDDQYSYAHVRVFSLHNSLYYNPALPDLAFYVDEKWNIVQLTIGRMNRCEGLTTVCEIPCSRAREKGDFPLTLQFTSAERAVIADGTGTYHVAAVKKNKWVILFSDRVTSSCPSLLLSAAQSNEFLLLLFRSIVEPKFDSILHFVVLDENWQTIQTKKIQVFGNIRHASIESLQAITLIQDGQKYPKFIGDDEDTKEDCPRKYRWTQTADDVSISVNVKEVHENDVIVTAEGQHLSVTIKGEKVIDGPFAGAVNSVVWETKDGNLDIRAEKNESGEGWRFAIEGDENGEQYQVECREETADQPYSTDELEDVDVASPSSLIRLHLEKMDASHVVDLSTQQFLFSIPMDVDKPPAVCVRHLTDACAWRLETKDDSWIACHIGTFHAFGYVQASKTQRKFIAAPENLSYVVISDAFRHLYVFRQPSQVNGTLRNRTSGAKVDVVSRQHLINLEDKDEVLGIRATNNLLLILTKRKFYILVINETLL